MSDNQEEAELNSEVANGFKEEDETYDEDVDTYYFESDHVALKGNPDYHMLLKTIILLESQRMQALKDLDKLHQCQADSLKDPIEFVKKLQSGADIGFPRRQQVATIPNLNWGKYTKNVDFLSLGLPKHMTRLKRQLVEGSPDVDQMPGSSGGSEQQVTVVRGRLKDDSKSITFNKLWNVEEQKRLEDLLIQYQPEEVEARRWQKIATALGNRTPQQVASRVQKYFIKLAKAGLPIPGRLPNLATHNKKSAHRHHRFHKFYHQQSTFLSSHEPPVYMSDDESMTADDPMYDDSNSYQPDSYTPAQTYYLNDIWNKIHQFRMNNKDEVLNCFEHKQELITYFAKCSSTFFASFRKCQAKKQHYDQAFYTIYLTKETDVLESLQKKFSIPVCVQNILSLYIKDSNFLFMFFNYSINGKIGRSFDSHGIHSGWAKITHLVLEHDVLSSA